MEYIRGFEDRQAPVAKITIHLEGGYMRKIFLVMFLVGMLVMPAGIMAQNTLDEASALLDKDNDLDAYKKAVEILSLIHI